MILAPALMCVEISPEYAVKFPRNERFSAVFGTAGSVGETREAEIETLAFSKSDIILFRYLIYVVQMAQSNASLLSPIITRTATLVRRSVGQ